MTDTGELTLYFEVAAFTVTFSFGAFYAWLTSELLKELWDRKMAFRRARRAAKANQTEGYNSPR